MGRFELLVLHACLVLRRLNRSEAPGPAVAQELVDRIFKGLDDDLREAGVGDLAVPKRMKKLAEAFLGRSSAYDRGLDEGEAALAEALKRNLYDGAEPSPDVVRYVAMATAALDSTELDALLRRPLPFPSVPVSTVATS